MTGPPRSGDVGSLWRKLNPGQQALLVLVYLRKGETFASLAAGFGVGTATAWRYVEETAALPTARAPRLRNIVTHEYARIDYEIVWNALALRVPEIAAFVRGVFAAPAG